jgi:hypothetical protein
VSDQTTPTIGLGTVSAIGGVIAAGAAFLTAAIDAGLDDTPFYSDPGVTTLFVTFIGAVAALFAGRSYQAGKLTEAAAPPPPANVEVDGLPVDAHEGETL